MSTGDPDSVILRLLRDMRAEIGDIRAEIGDIRAEVATKKDIADVRSEMRSEINSLRADVASDMTVLRKEVGEQIAGLRRAVVEYHSSVVGHGILISELEARVRRVEQHLNLPTIDTN